MYLDLENEPENKIYFFGNYDERHEPTLVRRILEPGDVFWDVGANIGFYSMLASIYVGNSGHVIAFEPGKIAYSALEKNVKLNGFLNIKPYNFAVSNAYGKEMLYSSGDVAFGEATIIKKQSQEYSNIETCKVIALYQFMKENKLNTPTFIKIDVEGSEVNVLEGAEEILCSEKPPMLLVEMNERVRLQSLLKKFGYLPASLRRRKWHFLEDVTQVKERNVFWFNPKNKFHLFRIKKVPIYGSQEK